MLQIPTWQRLVQKLKAILMFFFKTIFDDKNDSEFDLSIMAGDFNVAPDHNLDTLGYLHINNPNSRFFINKMKSLNMMTDVFRHKHPDTRITIVSAIA